jgi:hypothetical protein
MTVIKNAGLQISNDRFGFNVFIIVWIWASMVFVGIRAIILSFANMMFDPLIGCMTLGLTVIGILSLIYILRAKKWALFLWIAYRLSGAFVNTYVIMNRDLSTNITIAIVNIILMLLLLQIKKNGVSAWSIIFNKNKLSTILHGDDAVSNTNEENRDCCTLFSDIDTNSESKESQITLQDTNVQIEDERNTITKHLGWEKGAEKKQLVDETNDFVVSSDSYNHHIVMSNPKDEKRRKLYLIITMLSVALLGVAIWLATRYVSQESSRDTKESMEIFDCGLFSFEYPSTFKTIPIQNAPHMILKLESDDYMVSISYWDYGLGEDASIWNDEYFERYKQMPIEDGSLVDIAKVGVQTKEGFVKSLKLKTNINSRNNDLTTCAKLLTYLIFHNGCLLVFVFESEGAYPIPMPEHYPTTYPDEIMKGLTLKSNKDNLKAFDDETDDNNDVFERTLIQTIHNEIESATQDYNKDLPEKIGYGMTMIRCALEGHTIVYTIRWEGMGQSDFSAKDIAELKDGLIEGMIKEKDSPIMKVMLNSMREYGYYFIYRFINEREESLCSIKINPFEI